MRVGKSVAMFGIWLLAMLEDLMPSSDGGRVGPRVDELARALTEPDRLVSYDSGVAIEQYPVFRGLLDECYRDFGPLYERMATASDVEPHALIEGDTVITQGTLGYFRDRPK
jgi:hypothetical protein